MISGDLWGGAEAMTCNLLRGLKEYPDIDLSAILFNQGKLYTEILKMRIPVEVVDESSQGFLLFLRKVRDVLRRRPPDILHSHRLKENIVAYLSASRGNGTRFVCTQHGMPEHIGGGLDLKDLILPRANIFLISNQFARMVAVSENIRASFVQQFGIPEGKVVVIHNGIESDRSLRAESIRKEFVIGSSGRLFPVKDYPLMVAVAERVLEQTRRVRFELAGDGPDMDRLRGMIRDKGLEDRFLLLGFLENMSSFYEGIDLYLNTSVHEGIPMSVLEAMARGIPAVAPNAGGLREILDDEVSGYLVDGRNPEDFARKCLRLFEDRMLHQRMGIAARKRVESEFSSDRMTERYYRLYSELMGWQVELSKGEDPAGRHGDAT